MKNIHKWVYFKDDLAGGTFSQDNPIIYWLYYFYCEKCAKLKITKQKL